MRSRITTDLRDDNARPYFLWDEVGTVGDLRARLASTLGEERNALIGKLMREARDTDVWLFVTPQEVWNVFPKIVRYLGRQRPFWKYLFESWARDGFVK